MVVVKKLGCGVWVRRVMSGATREMLWVHRVGLGREEMKVWRAMDLEK